MSRSPTALPRTVTWLLASAVALGCSEPTAQPHANLSVTVVSEPIPWSTASINGAPNWAGGFSLDVLLRNQSTVASAEYLQCGPALERESQPGTWTRDVEPMCALEGTNPIVVPPLGEVQLHSTIFGGYPVTTVAPGRFRLLYRYFTTGVAGTADEARSAPFELK